jgi:hypothetical protein
LILVNEKSWVLSEEVNTKCTGKSFGGFYYEGVYIDSTTNKQESTFLFPPSLTPENELQLTEFGDLFGNLIPTSPVASGAYLNKFTGSWTTLESMSDSISFGDPFVLDTF